MHNNGSGFVENKLMFVSSFYKGSDFHRKIHAFARHQDNVHKYIHARFL